MTMKTIKTFLLGIFVLGCISPLMAERSDDDELEDVYDLYNPTAKTTHVWISITGDTSAGRVSLIKGKNPLQEKDAKGNPLVKPDDRYETVYCKLNNYGGEDVRAFHLGALVPLNKDGGWKRYVINFTPRRNGKVKLFLRAEHHPEMDMFEKDYYNMFWGGFAKLEAVNAKFKDTNFTKPKYWNADKFYYFPKELKSEVIAEEGAPTPKILRAVMPVWQECTVKKDVPVTISFYVRSDNAFKSKK